MKKKILLGLFLLTLIFIPAITVAFEEDQNEIKDSPLYKITTARALNKGMETKVKFLEDRITILSLAKLLLKMRNSDKLYMWATNAPITCPLAECLTVDCHTVYPVCSQDGGSPPMMPKVSCYTVPTCSGPTCRGLMCFTRLCHN